MLHFFINTGIKDTAYYWNELSKCMNVYCELKKICPELDSLNIGGGFPDQELARIPLRLRVPHRGDRGPDQEHLPAQRRGRTEHFHRIRLVHRGRKRRIALLDREPEAAERPRELVHDRLLVHHHAARHVGHQPALHHARHQQLGQGVPARAAGRPDLRQRGFLQLGVPHQRHLPPRSSKRATRSTSASSTREPTRSRWADSAAYSTA